MDISLKGKHGIYKITNNHNGDFYIGSAKCIYTRWHCHVSQLRKQAHGNAYLQRVFNKYGIEGLTFSIVEAVSEPRHLIEREQWFIDSMNPTINMCRIAGNTLGNKHSEETKAYLSKIRKGKNYSLGRKFSEETKEKIAKKARERGLSESFKRGSILANTGRVQSKEEIERRIVKQSKLNEEQVREIDKMIERGAFQKEIAQRFGISQRLVVRVKYRIGFYGRFEKNPT